MSRITKINWEKKKKFIIEKNNREIINDDSEIIIQRTYYLKETVITKTMIDWREDFFKMCGRKKKKRNQSCFGEAIWWKWKCRKRITCIESRKLFLICVPRVAVQWGRGFSREFSKGRLNVYRRSVNRFYATAFSGLSGILFQFIARFSFLSFTVGMLKRSDEIE